MKVKIKNKMYEMKIIPRELTAVLISDGEPIKDDDNAFMLFHCPCPKDPKDISKMKKYAVEKAINNFEELERHIECIKTLHKGDENESKSI